MKSFVKRLIAIGPMFLIVVIGMLYWLITGNGTITLKKPFDRVYDWADDFKYWADQ